jgi:hypothetical protein
MVGYEEIIAILGIVGIGGIIATSLTYVYEKRKQIKFREQEYKEMRCKAMVPSMKVILKLDDLKYMQLHRPDLQSMEDVKNEVETECYNSLLFASDDVVKSLKEFILTPNSARMRVP